MLNLQNPQRKESSKFQSATSSTTKSFSKTAMRQSGTQTYLVYSIVDQFFTQSGLVRNSKLLAQHNNYEIGQAAKLSRFRHVVAVLVFSRDTVPICSIRYIHDANSWPVPLLVLLTQQ